MEQSSISGELNLQGITLTPYGRIGISWTLRQTVGQTSRRRHRISGQNSWKETTSIGSSDAAGCVSPESEVIRDLSVRLAELPGSDQAIDEILNLILWNFLREMRIQMSCQRFARPRAPV